MKYAHQLIALTLLFTAPTLQATHIVGGEIYYRCLGGNQYEITMKIYRDCYLGQAGFDDPAYLFVYEGNNLYTTLSASPTITNIPIVIDNPCLVAPPNVCVEEGVYVFNTTLPASAIGYDLVYQRCCRNNSIDNLQNPGTQGATYWQHIPGSNLATCNSSPYFANFPPVGICANDFLNFDHHAVDPDGDSLVYELCTPYRGGSTANPIPNPASPPPYSPVQYAGGYSYSYPINANPPFTINPTTGQLTGQPLGTGQYVVGVCVKEYRNGVLIANHYRDFQFNLANCDPTVIAGINSGIDTIKQCDGLTVGFTNTSIGATDYHWDFGNTAATNDTSNQVNASYTYPDTGIYIVTLIANPGFQCSDTTTTVVVLYDPFQPDFSYVKQCPGTPMQFNDLSTVSQGTIVSWSWNFGDGGTASVKNPTHTYNSNGPFWVTLTMTSSTGCKTIYTELVSPHPKPNANFTFSTPCLDKPTQFTNTSTITSGTITTWNWTFGDGGTSSVKDPIHTYVATGTYTVTLIVTSDMGCKDTVAKTLIIKPKPVAVADDDTIACFGDPVQLQASGGWYYLWKPAAGLSNPNIANPIATPSATTTYTVIVSDDCWADSTTVTIVVNPTPTASFSNTVTCVGDTFHFTDMSLPNGSTIVSWSWDFGDGGMSSLQNPTHIFTGNGPFNVTLTVVNNFGCDDDYTLTVVPYPLPEVDFTRDLPCLNQPTQFTDLTTILSGTLVSWSWSFGDGGTSTLQNPTHTYTSTGDFTVTLVVTSNHGCVDSITKIIHIDPLVVAYASPDTMACYGELIELRAWGGLWYHWEPATEVVYADSAVTYVAPSQTMTFTVTVSDSCSADTETVTVTVFPLPNLDVSPDQSIYPGDEAEIWANGYPDVIDYTWTPTSSIVSPSTEDDPELTVQPENTTVYTITVTDINGCQKTGYVVVKVLDVVIAVPNAFTPNGDGHNDEVYVITIGEAHIDFFRIYNRWGELLFETNGTGPGTGWDGTFKGVEQPVGAFTYVVNVPDGPHQKGGVLSGSITLMR